MSRTLLSCSLLLLVNACAPGGDASDGGDSGPVRVDPLIGTGGNGFNVGSSYPGAVAPGGLAAPSPDTSGPTWGEARFLHCSGYWAGDDTIQGFSNLHMHGTGLPDYGVLALMPLPAFDASRTTRTGYASTFKKQSEHAEPGYYEVTLDNGGIRVELTATRHVALHRYTFPAGTTSGHVVVDLAHVLGEGRVTGAAIRTTAGKPELSGHFRSFGDMSGGYGYPVAFTLRASAPWRSSRMWSEAAAPETRDAIDGERVGASLEFDISDGKPLTFVISIVIGGEAATTAAIEDSTALRDFDFDAVRRQTDGEWAVVFGRAHIVGGTGAEKTMFLTALYHAFVMPTIMTASDGTYLGFDGATHHADDGGFLSNLSLWDTYRTLHPLYTLLAPSLARDCARSLTAMAKQSGFFPKWPLASGDAGSMVGAGAEVVLADAYLKGVTDFDARGAYAMLRAAAMDPLDPPGGRGGRGDVPAYMEYGYVPSTSGGKVSVTLELSQDDFALGNLAAALGEQADADALLARRLGYRKLFDPTTGFLRGRLAGGTLAHPGGFDPVQSQADYVEANAWQSLWVAHDVDGMIALLGSRAALVQKLETMFELTKMEWESIGDDVGRRATPRPYYWAGNEPDIHAVYLFAQAGRPDLTQKWVKWIMSAFYGTGVDGLPGNDDGGTMSAWYIFSALGFYPLAGSNRYIVGAPLFPYAEIAVAGGTLMIRADNFARENLYVQSVMLNGAPLERAELKHSQLSAGGFLTFMMGPEPSNWARQD